QARPLQIRPTVMASTVGLVYAPPEASGFGGLRSLSARSHTRSHRSRLQTMSTSLPPARRLGQLGRHHSEADSRTASTWRAPGSSIDAVGEPSRADPSLTLSSPSSQAWSAVWMVLKTPSPSAAATKAGVARPDTE